MQLSREQITNFIKGIRTDLKLFKGIGHGHYYDRAQKNLERLLELKKELSSPIDKHELNVIQLEVEKLTWS